MILFLKAMAIVGFAYIGQCNIKQIIPVWLIVFGTVGTLKVVLRLFLNVFYNHRLKFFSIIRIKNHFQSFYF